MTCLLGSGVSRAADIPTGWEIVVDLMGKLAVLEGSTAQGEQELLKWFLTRYGHEPDYSELIERLAPQGELQRGLLEPYFTQLDPATEERREREPTAAHHAIARLVSRGVLRVIITTNFDRLMESALRQAGVANIEVVSTYPRELFVGGSAASPTAGRLNPRRLSKRQPRSFGKSRNLRRR